MYPQTLSFHFCPVAFMCPFGLPEFFSTVFLFPVLTALPVNPWKNLQNFRIPVIVTHSKLIQWVCKVKKSAPWEDLNPSLSYLGRGKS